MAMVDWNCFNVGFIGGDVTWPPPVGKDFSSRFGSRCPFDLFVAKGVCSLNLATQIIFSPIFAVPRPMVQTHFAVILRKVTSDLIEFEFRGRGVQLAH